MIGLPEEQIAELKTLLEGYDTFLLSCCAKKDDTREFAPAGEMYLGGYFKKQLQLAAMFSDDIYIMSSKYGLISLDEEISPYRKIWHKGQIAGANQKSYTAPIATEAERLAISENAQAQLKGRKVLSFCSKTHRKYQPDFDYFNEIVSGYCKQNGFRNNLFFLNRVMHQLLTGG